MENEINIDLSSYKKYDYVSFVSLRSSDFSIPSGYLQVDSTYYNLPRTPIDINDFISILTSFNIPNLTFIARTTTTQNIPYIEL